MPIQFGSHGIVSIFYTNADLLDRLLLVDGSCPSCDLFSKQYHPFPDDQLQQQVDTQCSFSSRCSIVQRSIQPVQQRKPALLQAVRSSI